MGIKFDVSLDFLDKAEEQIYEILLNQRMSYNERLSNRPVFITIKPVLRVLGVMLSLLGGILCGASILGGSQWCFSFVSAVMYIIFFVASGLLFYFLPHIEVKIKAWLNGLSTKSCRKLSQKCIQSARMHAPYRAEYDIKGGAISYYREKDDELKLVWTRALKGVAVQSDCATIIFKKWASFLPVIVILHKDFEIIGGALSEQKVECKSFSDL